MSKTPAPKPATTFTATAPFTFGGCHAGAGAVIVITPDGAALVIQVASGSEAELERQLVALLDAGALEGGAGADVPAARAPVARRLALVR